MAEVIRMPKMSDTMEEGVIATWLKKEGEEVSSGDVLAEVETDKATMELESYNDGILLHIGIKEKQSVPVDGVIAIIGEKGEDISALIGELKNEMVEEEIQEESNATVEEPTKASELMPMDTSGINASIVTMPKMSDTMTEGVISAWLKKVGDKIESGDILAEVETDKATMELESYEDGILLYTAVETGKGVPVDGVIAVIGEEGVDFQPLLEKAPKTDVIPKSPAPKAEAKPAAVEAPASVAQLTPTSATIPSTNGRIKASPLAKKLASEKGIDIKTVTGSGDGGRIVKKDVENFDPSSVSSESGSPIPAVLPAVVGEERSDEVAVSQMRKTIAKRLSSSKFNAPHFYLTMEINMDKAIEARKSMNEVSPVKLSFNDMILKATAAAIRQNPDVNVSWEDDRMMKHQHIHIGVAMAIPDGLVVPVIRFADNKSLAHISAEVKAYGQKAKEKKLQLEDFTGNTFTISNLGMFGIEEFTAIINSPDSCIMAVGGIQETVIVKNGEMKPGNVMKVTLSCDHRAVDGAVGAAFLQTFKGLLEDPVRILI
ncbi:MAG: pyruvate dehydrogenase complex dihydrolipoamide acetyltransferase [Cytophagales bacterium]|nr:pyruvate dehydrogenase complex dihydrolipoamide acetyltransferase [Cytophagales bacterium]